MSQAQDITDAATFERWWQRRDLPDDRAATKAARSGGLVKLAGGLLWLTEAGKDLRREGERLRGAR